jgi:TPR repeat protein
MPVEPCRFYVRMTGVIVVVLLSVSGAMAGALDDCAAAYDRQDYVLALRLCRPLAEQGDPSAQTALGMMYERGDAGVPQDYVEAAKWYRKAAEQGDAYGQTALGNLYYEGWGVEQNYTRAANWFQKAAEQGGATGQFGLGVAYEQGDGVL